MSQDEPKLLCVEEGNREQKTLLTQGNLKFIFRSKHYTLESPIRQNDLPLLLQKYVDPAPNSRKQSSERMRL